MAHPKRLSLARLPTPLQRLPRLSREYGVELWIKRDDMAGMDFSGNKVRKLEFVLHDAMDLGSDMLLTAGGAGSNLCRAVASFGRAFHMETRLFLRRPVTGRLRGTLTSLPGAKATFLTRHEFERVEERLAEEAEFWRRAGRKPYVIPPGASTPLGACGYAEPWWRELSAQSDLDPDTVAVAVGSGGSMAGLLSGASTVGYTGRIMGFSVARPAREAAARTAALCAGCEAFGYASVRKKDISVTEAAPAGAPTATEEDHTLLRHVAESEGLMLDPSSTGKAFSALLREIRAGKLRGKVLFVHTGGVFGLFSPNREHSVSINS